MSTGGLWTEVVCGAADRMVAGAAGKIHVEACIEHDGGWKTACRFGGDRIGRLAIAGRFCAMRLGCRRTVGQSWYERLWFRLGKSLQ